MVEINEAVGENNCIDRYGGKSFLVFHCKVHEFWKCIGCIILAVTYGTKGTQVWGTNELSISKKGQNK